MIKYWKTIIWALFIFVISSIPGNKIPDVPIWNIDKFVHSFVYFILSVLFIWECKSSVWYRLSKPKVVFLILFILYGGMIEVLQAKLFINRSGDILDFLANTLGVLFVTLVIYFASLIKRFDVNKR